MVYQRDGSCDIRSHDIGRRCDYMAAKKKGKPLSARDKLKLEIAAELGILEQVERDGWESLSNAVCGKVGGIMSRRLRERQNDI